VTSASGAALVADHITVSGDARLDSRGHQPFCATGTGETGAVRLVGASVTGHLSLTGAELTNHAGPAVFADLLSVKGATYLDGRLHATRGLRLWGAMLTGQLSMEGAKIETHVLADHQEPGSAAAVWLSSATIGRLVLRGATLSSDTGSALIGDYLTVRGDAFVWEPRDSNFPARGASELGTLCLPGAHVAGQLTLRGSELTNSSSKDEPGPALLLDEAEIQGDVLIDEAFTAIAPSSSAAVSFDQRSDRKAAPLHAAAEEPTTAAPQPRPHQPDGGHVRAARRRAAPR